MFTGIITHQGTIENITFDKKKDVLIEISINKKLLDRKLKIGSSVSCNGICLTLIEQRIVKSKLILFFQASEETCNRTTLQKWQKNQKINLEFSLRIGDELGGHLVLGHIDETGEIISIKKVKESWRFDFKSSKAISDFIAKKGSITIDGVSLTINEVKNNSFSTNIIPHTFDNTIFQFYKIGDFVNFEIDLIARQISRQLAKYKTK